MIYEIITEFYTEFQLTLSHTHTHTKPNWEIQVFLIMDTESAVLCFFFCFFGLWRSASNHDAESLTSDINSPVRTGYFGKWLWSMLWSGIWKLHLIWSHWKKKSQQRLDLKKGRKWHGVFLCQGAVRCSDNDLHCSISSGLRWLQLNVTIMW